MVCGSCECHGLGGSGGPSRLVTLVCLGSDSLFLSGCSFFNLLAFAKIVQPGKHGNIYEAAAATISTVCTLVIDMMVNNVIVSNKCKNSSRSDAASFHFGGGPTSVNFFNKFTQFASRADRFISVHLLCHNSLYGTLACDVIFLGCIVIFFH